MSLTPLLNDLCGYVLPLLLAIFFQRDVPMNGANRQRRTRSNDVAGKDYVKIGCDIRRLSERNDKFFQELFSFFHSKIELEHLIHA